MSHAWNACGSHIPQGFKSPILRHWEVPLDVIIQGDFFFIRSQAPVSPRIELQDVSVWIRNVGGIRTPWHFLR